MALTPLFHQNPTQGWLTPQPNGTALSFLIPFSCSVPWGTADHSWPSSPLASAVPNAPPSLPAFCLGLTGYPSSIGLRCGWSLSISPFWASLPVFTSLSDPKEMGCGTQRVTPSPVLGLKDTGLGGGSVPSRITTCVWWGQFMQHFHIHGSPLICTAALEVVIIIPLKIQGNPFRHLPGTGILLQGNLHNHFEIFKWPLIHYSMGWNSLWHF